VPYDEEEKILLNRLGRLGWRSGWLAGGLRVPAVDAWAHGLPLGYCRQTSTR
jgi:hypothetical protein